MNEDWKEFTEMNIIAKPKVENLNDVFKLLLEDNNDN